MASTVGIKIANGDFYSIVEENTNARKRLILTTVHDNQESMQIDLYRSQIQSMTDSQYIGSIVVENIKPKNKGDPSIELIISSSADGTLSADATDLDSSVRAEHQHLSVSLRSMDMDTQDYTLPNFELETGDPPPQGLYDKASKIREQGRRKKAPWLPVIIIGLLIIAAAAALWFLFLRDRIGNPPGRPVQVEQPSRKPEETPPPPPPPPPPAPARTGTPPPPPAPVPVIEAPRPAPEQVRPAPPVARRTRPPAPVSGYRVPAVIPREGAPYQIRWGDTLWDIAEAFYRNPWLYPRIARFNRIRDPDMIIAGRTIRIPPRN